MRESICLGIDPGATGGFAGCGEGGLKTAPMPKTPAATWQLLAPFVGVPSGSVYAVLEQVGGYVGGGGQPGSAMFNFGANYGMLRAFLIAAGVPYKEVVPRVWQTEFGLVKGRTEPKTEWKNRLAVVARKLFPDAKITLPVADAVLLAEFCRRMRTAGLRRGKK